MVEPEERGEGAHAPFLSPKIKILAYQVTLSQPVHNPQFNYSLTQPPQKLRPSAFTGMYSNNHCSIGT